MNWLTNLVRPKIQALMKKKDVPENLWEKCPKCEHMLFHRDLVANQNVCHHCQHHLRIPVRDRLKSMFDEGSYKVHDVADVAVDPLKFKDSKRYTDRLKDYRSRTNERDVVVVASGQMAEKNVVVAAFNFSFMGGSMGMHVGESIVSAAELAIKNKAPLIVIPASGGARMQEGILSLMQMPRTTVALEMVKDAGLPYLTILTDPTTGGVSASFAMLGDIAIAEPGAIIGFAGRRVIENTIREKLPDDFQTSEHLREHGMVDLVVHRHNIRQQLIKLFNTIHPAVGNVKIPRSSSSEVVKQLKAS